MNNLSAKQNLFVQEYMKDLNGKHAAIRAGYSEPSAEVQASKMLRRGKVKDAVAVAMEARIEDIKIDANWVLNRLVEEAEADLADLYGDNGKLRPITEWPKIWRQGLVAGVDVTHLIGDEDKGIAITKLKLSDRVKRLEMIGKHIDVKAFATSSDQPILPRLAEEISNLEAARRVAYLLTRAADSVTIQ